MTVDERIDYLFKEKNNISSKDIINALDACSAVDPVAAPDALTIFYSGGEDEIINAIAGTDNSKVRLIRRTEGFKLMTSSDGTLSFSDLVSDVIRRENPTLTLKELEDKIGTFMYGISPANSTSLSMTDEHGLWTRLSAKFADETTGNAYSLCTDALEDRIYSRDELKHWLSTASDNATMNGITKSELSKYSGTERFEMVVDSARKDLANTELTTVNHVGTDGKEFLSKTGRTFTGSSLEDYIPDTSSKVTGDIYKFKSNEYTDAMIVLYKAENGTSIKIEKGGANVEKAVEVVKKVGGKK